MSSNDRIIRQSVIVNKNLINNARINNNDDDYINYMHPKKRKYIQYIQSRSLTQTTSDTEDLSTILAIKTEKEKVETKINYENPYQLHFKLKKEIQERQNSYVSIEHKLPKNHENYLTFNGEYGLEKEYKKILPKYIERPIIKYPPNLSDKMFIEYIKQNLERHKLSVQHLIEKDKLILVVEQELFRVQTRAKFLNSNQIPLSACTILCNKEIYTLQCDHKREVKEPQNKRQITERILCSSLEELKNKWEIVKQEMLNRHKNEAESLNALQKIRWEMKLKKFGICPYRINPTIDINHVPIIAVTNFNLPI